MLVMPSAVLEVPNATVLDACAIGSAACAELDNVGPNTIATLSWKISFLKTLMASSFLPCSSSITSAILLPLMPPAALISSAASWKPLRMATPYWAAPPDSASATPILMSCAADAAPVAIAAPAATAVNSSCLIIFFMRTCSLFVRRDCVNAIRLEDALAQHRRSPACALHRVRPRACPRFAPCRRKRLALAKQRKTYRASDAGSGTRASGVRRSVKRRRHGYSALVRRAGVTGARSQSRDFTGKRTTVR